VGTVVGEVDQHPGPLVQRAVQRPRPGDLQLAALGWRLAAVPEVEVALETAGQLVQSTLAGWSVTVGYPSDSVCVYDGKLKRKVPEFSMASHGPRTGTGSGTLSMT
jgi:hypothetical protein